MPNTEHFVETGDADETRAMGAALARHLKPGDVLLLHGDLGAGKTTLTQGIAQGLAITGPVQSPTFTLVSEHVGQIARETSNRLYHLDLYRLGGEEDLDDIGFADLIAPLDGITIIEWPERAGTWLPDRYLLVTIEPTAGGGRRFTIDASRFGRPLNEFAPTDPCHAS